MEQTVDKNREAWEEDISLQDAMKEVQRAKARINTKKKMQDFAKALDARSQIDRWRKMYEFLANYNPALTPIVSESSRSRRTGTHPANTSNTAYICLKYCGMLLLLLTQRLEISITLIKSINAKSTGN